MRNIRSRLLQIFVIEIAVLGVAAVFSLFLYVNAANKYKAISDNMVSEYHLTETAFGLITDFNQLAVSSTGSSQAAQKTKISSSKTQISQLYATLDQSITDPDTKNSYVGLKNAINGLMVEIDAGVTSIQNGGQDATAHYNKANQLYGFVKEDGNVFLNDELQHVTVTQQEVRRSTTRNFQIGAVSYALILIGSLIYAVRMSRVIVKPIDELAATAEQITRGNMETEINPKLLERKDETGKLSNSFNMMLLNLKQKIHELNLEKAGVEQKVIDRTEELNNEKARLEASINSIDVGFIMTGINDDIIMLNRVATRLLAYTLTPEGVSKVDTSIHEWTTDLVDQKMSGFPFKENIAKAKSLSLPVEKKEQLYGGRIFRVFIAPIVGHGKAGKSVETLGTVTLIEDITERKVQERSKDEFFSIASHELRTPLTAIRGNTSMIQTYYQDQLAKDENLKGMVDDIHESSVRLIEIVSDFLDVSRLEQGKMKFEPEAFELDKVIESVVYELANTSQAKGVELKFNHMQPQALPTVYADKNRTKQVIYNLVGNALKFTEKGTITVGIKPEDSVLKVLVSDTGTGMNAESQQLLFHKFQQAGRSLITRNTAHGTGLGLYISKLLVGQMGGSIQLESSAPGSGSVFSFSLPTAKPPVQSY